MKSSSALVFAVLLTVSAAHAAEPKFESGPRQKALLDDYGQGLSTNPAFFTRLSRYAKEWKEVEYTPCMILNGKEWREWHERDDVPANRGKNAGTLTVKGLGDRRFRAEFEPTDGKAAGFRLHVALLGIGISMRVRGKLREQDFVALQYGESGVKLKNGVYGAEFTLKEPLVIVEHEALAVWITRGRDASPIQAAGGWLD